MVWRELKETFQTLLRQCESSAHELDCSLIQPTCYTAGKAIFEMLSEGQNPFGLGEEFKSPPIAESMPPDGRPIEHYSEYWLCILGVLAKKERIHIGNRKLLRTKIPPISWAGLDCDMAIAERFFEDSKAYIREVCNGSVQACEKLLVKPSEWKPKTDYIGSKTIVNDHKVPRSTLQGWQNRDNPPTDKDPKTQEVYYPEKWLREKLKHRNSVT